MGDSVSQDAGVGPSEACAIHPTQPSLFDCVNKWALVLCMWVGTQIDKWRAEEPLGQLKMITIVSAWIE